MKYLVKSYFSTKFNQLDIFVRHVKNKCVFESVVRISSYELIDWTHYVEPIVYKRYVFKKNIFECSWKIFISVSDDLIFDKAEEW